MNIAQRLFLVAAAIAGSSGPVRADTLLDKLKPHVGQEVLVSTQQISTLRALTLLSVGDDYFCFKPSAGADQCLNGNVLVKVIIRSGQKYPLGLTVALPLGMNLPDGTVPE